MAAVGKIVKMTNLDQKSEQDLVREAREGNRESFSALVRLYQERAVMMANTVLRNSELAKDASQNAFVKAYFGLKNFRDEAQFKTWLFRIVINEAKDTYRKERSRGFFKSQSTQSKAGDDEGGSIFDLIPSKDLSPREAFEVLESKKVLERAIRTLPDREQEVFMLRYFHDLPLSEISEVLEIALGTVKAHLAQGLEKLKAHFSDKILISKGVSHGRS